MKQSTKIFNALLICCVLISALILPTFAQTDDEYLEASAVTVSNTNLLSTDETTGTTPVTRSSSGTGQITDEAVARSTELYQNFLSADLDFFLMTEEGIRMQAYLNSSGFSDSELAFMQELVDSIVANCTTPSEEIYAVAKYMAQNLCYDYDYYNGESDSTLLDPYDVLTNEYTICSGYARTFHVLMQLLGHPCATVSSPDHAWNLVHNGERWMLVDVTWITSSKRENGINTKSDAFNTYWYDFTIDTANSSYNHLISGLPFSLVNNTLERFPAYSIAKHYTVPDTVTSIKEYCFNYSALESITIPDSVTSIGEAAFSNCKQLTQITVGNGVSVLNGYTFSSCPNLEEITLGKNITEISYYVFPSSNKLRLIRFAGTSAEWDKIEFHVNSEFPSDVQIIFTGYPTTAAGTIGDLNWTLDNNGTLFISGIGDMPELAVSDYPWNAYRDSIRTLVIEEGVSSIGQYAFDSCEQLANMLLPDSMNAIGAYAFRNCDKLGRAAIPNGVSTVEASAFSSCDELFSIVLPDSISVIKADAFSSCGSLTTVSLPAGLSSIEANAFLDCMDLKVVLYAGTRAEWNSVSVSGTGNTALTNAEIICSDDIAQSGDCGRNSTWILSTNGTLVIRGIGIMNTSLSDAPWTDYRSLVNTIIIENGITSICEYAFYSFDALTEILIPNSVTSIDKIAFYECVKLQSISLPDSITSIGESAFARCDALTSIFLPKNLVTLGNSVFYYCPELAAVVLPDSLTVIEPSTFLGCTKLASVTLPANLTTIGGSAFNGCKALETITIPAYVTEIASNAFTGLTNLKSILVDPANTRYFSDDGVFCDRAQATLIKYPAQKANNSYTIPDGITQIASNAFGESWAENYALKSLTVPDGVVSLGANAFSHAYGLSVIELPSSISSIGEVAFSTNLRAVIFHGTQAQWDAISIAEDNDALENAALILAESEDTLTSGTCGDALTWTLSADGVMTISGTGAIPDYSYDYEAPAPWYNVRDMVRRIVIEDGVTSIGAYAFYRHSCLLEVTMGNSITSIGDRAFYWCIELTDITLSNTLTSIGNYAFGDCQKLTSIVLPDSLQTLGAAFNRSGLISITIPDGIIVIDGFYSCSQLVSITLPLSVRSVKASAFNGANALSDIYFAGTEDQWNCVRIETTNNEPFLNAAVHIGDQNEYLASGFCGQKAVWYLNEDGVLTITGSGVLTEYYSYPHPTTWSEHLDNVITVNISEGVTGIGSGVFKNCSNLTTITIPDGLNSVGDHAFSGCDSLASIILPDTVTDIGSYAFSSCNSLTSFDIPANVTSIGSGAFAGCSGLTSLILPDTVTSIGDSAFGDCTGLTSMNIPKNVVSLGTSLFSRCTNLAVITVDPENSHYIDVDGVLFTKDMTKVLCHPANHENTTYEIPDGVIEITPYAFWGCGKLTSITIPDSVVTIGSHAFTQCYGFRYIDIPNSVTTLGSRAFDYCNNLITIRIPDTITAITNGMFSRCFSFQSIIIPASVTSIESGAFDRCSLNVIYFTGTSEQWNALNCQETLTNVEIVFCDGHQLASGSCGDSSTWTLTEDGLLSIQGSGAIPDYSDASAPWYIHRSRIYTILVNDSITEIGQNAFYGLKYVTDVTLPDQIPTISSRTFVYCTLLQTISIPDSVTSIEEAAFLGCSNLKTIYFSGSEDEWNAISIAAGNDYLSSATIIFGEESPSLTAPVLSITLTESGLPVLSWSKVENAVKYEIWRTTGDGEMVKKSATAELSFIDSSATAGKSYSYQIRAVAGDTFSEFSNIVSVDCPLNLTAPELSITLNENGFPVLSWDTVENAVKYEIWRATGDGEMVKKSVTANLSFVDSSTTAGKSYSYQIRAVAGDTFSEFSNIVSIDCPLTLAVPTLTVTLDENGFPVLSWDTVDNAVKYEIWRATGDGEMVKKSATANLFFTDSSATAGKSYSYQIRAVAGDTFSEFSDTVTIDCPLSLDVPTLTVTLGESGFPVLSWNAVENAVKYEIWRATGDGEMVKKSATANLSFEDSSATSGKVYFYQIRAVAGEFVGEFSEIQSIAIPCDAPDISVAIDTASGKPVVTWDKISGATKYEVYRSTSENGTYTKTFTTFGTKYTNTNAKAGVTYYYKVIAVCGSNTDANSTFSVIKSITCICAVPEITVAIDTATNKPRVTWEAVTGATKYEVWRSTSLNGEYTKAFTTSGTKYTNTNAKAGVTYYYKVIAICSTSVAGNSVFSEIQSITCPSIAPTVTVKVDPSTGKPTVTWEAVTGATKYEIWRSTSLTGEYTRMFSTAGTKYTNTNASPGMTYYYKVRAIVGGISYDSEIFSATCTCAAPKVTTAVNSTTGKPVLTWGSVTGASKYEVWRSTSLSGEYSRMFSTTGTKYTNTNATAGVTYYYKVIALCGISDVGNSVFSEIHSVTCPAIAPEVTVKVDASTGKPTVTWEAVTGATKYEIWRSTSLSGEYTRMFSTTGTKYTNTNASPGTTYYYKVRAIVGGISYDSEIFSATCTCAAPKVTITIDTTTGKPMLTWASVTGATEYEVWRSTSLNGEYTKMFTTSGTKYINTNSKTGVTYYYKVIAICGTNSKGNSAYSDIKSISVE